MTRAFMMMPALSLLALSAVPSTAQQPTPANSHNPMLKDSTVRPTAAPATGTSSFTEDQARGRISKAGYTGVSKLVKGAGGAWMGMAMKGKKKVQVALDYKGNITAR